MLKGQEGFPNKHKSSRIHIRKQSRVFWHKPKEGVMIKVAKGVVGGMGTISYETSTSNETRGDPKLACRGTSSAKSKQG
jgi:hypothetical protein